MSGGLTTATHSLSRSLLATSTHRLECDTAIIILTRCVHRLGEINILFVIGVLRFYVLLAFQPKIRHIYIGLRNFL